MCLFQTWRPDVAGTHMHMHGSDPFSRWRPAVARLQPLRPRLQFPEAPSARGRGEPSLFRARDPETPLRDWPRGGDVRRGGGGGRAIETAEER